jgi:Flp pilus assembly protein TadG
MFRSAEATSPPPSIERRCRALAPDDSGAVAIEFSLVIGLIVMVVAGTLQLGMALMARNEMSYALSRVSRMIILDGSQTPAEVSALVTDRLSDYDPSLLSVSAAEATVAGTKFVEVSVEYPFETAIPFQALATLNLTAETMVPIVSSTK